MFFFSFSVSAKNAPGPALPKGEFSRLGSSLGMLTLAHAIALGVPRLHAPAALAGQYLEYTEEVSVLTASASGWILDPRVYEKPGQFTGCPDGQRNAAESECLAAVQEAATAHGEILEHHDLKEVDAGTEGWVPSGCSYSRGHGKTAIYNRNPAGRNSGSYPLVCIIEDDELNALRTMCPESELPSLAQCSTFDAGDDAEFSCAAAAGNATVNFLSCAEGENFERILPMFSFYALQNNPGAVVELVVPEPDAFIRVHQRSLAYVRHIHGSDSICVRTYNSPAEPAPGMVNTRRFFEVPERAAKYTYVSDVDILITEAVVSEKRLEQMLHNHVPYSDVLRRPPTEALTGLILVETALFYTPALLAAQTQLRIEAQRMTDESFLALLVKTAGLGLPPLPNETDFYSLYRPQHGLHLSNSRGPNNTSPMGAELSIEASPEVWCPVLQAPNLHGYLCVDELGRGHLASFASWTHAHPGRPLCEPRTNCGEFELREEEDRRRGIQDEDRQRGIQEIKIRP